MNDNNGDPVKRIVWLGESVARGYFYDPLYSPAAALESALRAADPDTPLEVVNLSESGLRFQPLLKSMQHARELNPDAVVILAGNNWRYNLEVPKTDKARQVRLQGPSGIFALEASVLADRARTFVNRAVTLFTEAGIRVLVIIPEFNLVDFGPPVSVTPPWLSNGAAACWSVLRKKAESSLAQGDYKAAANYAADLRAVENDTTGLGAHLHGRSLLMLGDVPAARAALEVARDRLDCPRLSSAGENAVRSACFDAGVPVLDLPREFEQFSGSLPDRALFHDYCHMTGRAIAFTACRTAELLAPALFGRPARPMLPAQFEPDPKIEAQAHLLAAYYTTIFGQSDDVVEHHFLEAAQFPQLRSAISLLADGYLRRELPLVLTRSWARLIEGACPELAEFTKNPPKERRRRLDTPIFHAAMKVCAEEREAIAALAEREHSLGEERPMDLLSETYLKRGTPVVWSGRVLKSLSAQTEFVFFAKQTSAAQVDIAWRTSSNTRPGSVCVSVNGSHVTAVPLTSSWSKSTIAIPNGLVKLGMNSLTVDWPPEVTGGPEDLNEDLAKVYEAQTGEARDATWNDTPDLCKLPKTWRPSFGHIDVLTISRPS